MIIKTPVEKATDYKRMIPLSVKIGQWAKANFNYEDPLTGMLEEFGEIQHCHLKRSQRIRGFDNDEYYITQLKDAFGDFGIYLLHGFHYYKVTELDRQSRYVDRDMRIKILETLAVMLDIARLWDMDRIFFFSRMFNLMDEYTAMCDVDFVAAIEETWEKIVSKRDWKVNPETGGEVAQ